VRDGRQPTVTGADGRESLDLAQKITDQMVRAGEADKK
jgi:hypothetical protein